VVNEKATKRVRGTRDEGLVKPGRGIKGEQGPGRNKHVSADPPLCKDSRTTQGGGAGQNTKVQGGGKRKAADWSNVGLNWGGAQEAGDLEPSGRSLGAKFRHSSYRACRFGRGEKAEGVGGEQGRRD